MKIKERLRLHIKSFPRIDENIVAYGYHGSCTWMLNGLGQLIISPLSGEYGFLNNKINSGEKKYWDDYAELIKEVVIRKGVCANVNASFLFNGLKNCTSINTENLNVFYTQNFSCMFDGCKKLKKLDMRNWNTAHAINMSGMFYGCQNLEYIEENFDTSNVKNMIGMFNKCKKLETLDINNFNIEKIQNMNKMFYSCKNLKELRFDNFFKKNFSKTCETQEMFFDCKKFKMKETEEKKLNSNGHFFGLKFRSLPQSAY